MLVPGGQGTRREIDNPVVIDWLRKTAARARFVTSVCTGSLLLLGAGLAAGQAHHDALGLRRDAAPARRRRPSSTDRATCATATW